MLLATITDPDADGLIASIFEDAGAFVVKAHDQETGLPWPVIVRAPDLNKAINTARGWIPMGVLVVAR